MNRQSRLVKSQDRDDLRKLFRNSTRRQKEAFLRPGIGPGRRAANLTSTSVFERVLLSTHNIINDECLINLEALSISMSLVKLFAND